VLGHLLVQQVGCFVETSRAIAFGQIITFFRYRRQRLLEVVGRQENNLPLGVSVREQVGNFSEIEHLGDGSMNIIIVNLTLYS
jgi:hypothetical protein